MELLNNKYVKLGGLLAALAVAYTVGKHQGTVARPLPRLPQPAALHKAPAKAPTCNCCQSAKHKKHNAKPKTAKHKKHKEKAGKAHQDAPPATK